MRTPGSAAELEVRRRIAGRLLLEGRQIADVARIVGVSWTSAKRWKKAVEQGGIEALAAKPQTGRPSKLSKQQKEKLQQLLLQGAVAAGFPNDLWSCPRVAQLIEGRFGVKYHKDYVWFVLHDLGWSCQLPQHRDRQQDPRAVARFRRRDWLRIKKGVASKS